MQIYWPEFRNGSKLVHQMVIDELLLPTLLVISRANTKLNFIIQIWQTNAHSNRPNANL